MHKQDTFEQYILFVLYCCLPVIIRVQLISLVAQKERPALYEHVQSSGLLVDGKRRVMKNFGNLLLGCFVVLIC